jgi:quinol monooxygenase YgiN
MKKFFIVELTIKQGERENLLNHLKNYAIEVRKEDGCECLDILVDQQSKNTVVLYEIWRDLASQLAHLETKGFANWKAFSDPLIEGFSVKTLESGE